MLRSRDAGQVRFLNEAHVHNSKTMTPDRTRVVPISIATGFVDKVPNDRQADLQRAFRPYTLAIDDIADAVLSGKPFMPAHVAMDDDGNSIRKNTAFQRAQLVCLDVDNSVTEHGQKRMKTESEGYLDYNNVAKSDSMVRNAFLLYTTPSHTDSWHRFRVVFCLPEPITDVGRYRDIVKAFIMRLGADESPKSPVNIFYGNTKAIIHPYGNVLKQSDVDLVIHWASNLEKEERVATDHINGNLSAEHVREMLKTLPPKLDYKDWVRVISGVASKFDEDTTVQLIESWSPGKPGEVRYKVRHRLERVGIGTVIYLAKQHGYRPPRDVYRDTKYAEDAGIEYKSVKYRLTQAGNGERFADAHRDVVRYCIEANQWYIWDGKRLAPDYSGEISRMALSTFREIIVEAAEVDDSKHRENVLKWAKSCESRATIDASLDLARRGTVLAVTADKLDSKPLCVNLNNGIFDLDTMTLCDHDIDELHTKIIPIDWDEHSECPKWKAFLQTIFAGDAELIEFMQRAVGYTLSALVSEECLFFAYGSGSNGKSIFFSVIDMLLGGNEGYAMKAKNDLVMMRRGDPGVPMDIAELRGRRFVYTDELPENRRFDESKIKDITSHDRLSGRFIFEKSFTFMPTHKLWMYGNHRPIITGQDEGIWRRIRLIPFTVTIPDSQKRPPEELKAEFRSEASGILRWAIEGFYRWRHDGGLRTPQSVKAASDAYRSEMDTIGSFIAEEIVETPGASLPHKALYSRYKAWCQEQGVSHVMTSKKLSRHLLETKGWRNEVDRKDSRLWIGRQLVAHEQLPMGVGNAF